VQLSCAGCGKTFEAKRSDAKFCGATCRQRGRRRGPVEVVVELPVGLDQAPAVELGLVDVYRAALVEADRLNTPLGQHVLTLARKMTSAFETGSGVAALSRQLDAVFDKAMKGVARGDSLDEFTERLRAKQAEAGRVG
jgi:hypothetical protein